MYIGVDIGGTKTLVAVLDQEGTIREQYRFPTPKDYPAFLKEVRAKAQALGNKTFQAGAVGIPGMINRNEGVLIRLGNLPWQNRSIGADMEDIFHCPMLIENDAKLAGLSESILLLGKYKKVLYVTISTGIGIGLIVNGKIDTNLSDAGGKSIVLEHEGKLEEWEEFASGRAIVARYGKRAEEITDSATWRVVSRDIAKGLIHLIAITEPEVVVIGGGVGTYFPRYQEHLKKELEKYHLPLITLPALVQAQRPEEAVIYGCYELAKQEFPHETAHK